MNGAQHYKVAETLLASGGNSINAAAVAQVHATLALVAVTAEAAIGDVDPELWLPVVSLNENPGAPLGHSANEVGFFGVDHFAERMFGMQVAAPPGKKWVLKTHTLDKCDGRPCVIHAPSNHHMRDWPKNWRADRGLMERMCKHGVGHPDPDDIAFKKSIGLTHEGVHGCDGCCAERGPAE